MLFNPSGELSISRTAFLLLEYIFGDIPGGTVVNNPPANAEDTDSSPGPRRFHVPRSN